jgi:hypothetical protein
MLRKRIKFQTHKSRKRMKETQRTNKEINNKEENINFIDVEGGDVDQTNQPKS